MIVSVVDSFSVEIEDAPFFDFADFTSQPVAEIPSNDDTVNVMPHIEEKGWRIY